MTRKPDKLACGNSIPLSVPTVWGKEWEYVKECLDTGWVSSAGPFVTRFEEVVAEFTGMRHAVAVSSGTAALHLALLVCGVERGDEVLIPSLTFIASANAVRYLDAYPTFIDVDPESWQLDIERLADFLGTKCDYKDGELRNRQTGRRVRAIMPVHLLGHPCQMESVVALAEKYGLVVVEDSAEALGSYLGGRHVGSFGRVSALSFNGNKIITTGGGGMLITDEPMLAERARYLSTQARDHAIEYYHKEIGFNYRLSNVSAAMGVAQLEKLALRLERKAEIAAVYRFGLKELPGVRFQVELADTKTNWWLVALTVDSKMSGRESREILTELRGAGIESRPIFQPLHGLPPFADCFADSISVATTLHQQALCLPSSPNLTKEQQDFVIERFCQCFA